MENSNECFSLSRNFRSNRGNIGEIHHKDSITKEDEKYILFNENQYSAGDSAYHSGSSYLSSTPHLSALSSSQFSTSNISTPSLNITKSSINHQSTNSDPICENSASKTDYLTLTPVTQNAQRISAFHITTPKNEPEDYCVNKRSSNFSLEEFQSTPKKIKYWDYDPCSTPQNHKTKNTNLFQRLHSAPDFENIKENEIELWQTSDKFITTQSTPKRTPLHSVQQIIKSSTPINLSSSLKLSNFSKTNSSVTPLNNVNENSMNNLLNCSNDVFDSILNSNSQNRGKMSSSKKTRKLENNENSFEFNSCLSDKRNSAYKPFRRFLKFNSQNTSIPISANESHKQNEKETSTSVLPKLRKCYPQIHSVIHDRLKAKKRVNAERLANLNRENSLEIFEDSTKCTKNIGLELFRPKTDVALNEASFSVNVEPIDMEVSPLPFVIKNTKKFKLETPCNVRTSLNMDISPITDSQNYLPPNNNAIDMNKNLNTVDLRVENLNGNNVSIEMLKSNEDTCLDDFIPLTPPPHKFDEVFKVVDKMSTNDNLNIKQEKSPLRTPRRKIIRSSSASSQNSLIYAIDKEKYKILYPTIPETPKKNSILLSPKKSPKKNKKYSMKLHQHNRVFYNGATFLNIIAKLEPYTIVLERIFYFLSDKDLLNLSMTTKVYRTIIQDNYKTNLRLIKFIREYKVRKENYCKKSQTNEKEKSDSLFKNIKIKPFSLHNEKFICKRDSYNELEVKNSIEKSPPVSPSKRKFHEYQKIIKNLSDKQKMAKCPRCSMASRIINQPPLDSFSEIQPNIDHDKNTLRLYNKEITTMNSNQIEVETIFDDNSNDLYESDFSNSKLPKSQPCPNTEVIIPSDSRRSSLISQIVTQNAIGKTKLTKAFSVDSWQGQIRKKHLLHEISKFEPYGECTSIRCKFKYCLECFCDYHPKQKCKLTASVSPSKEDIQNGILQIIKSPRKLGSNGRTLSLNMKRKSLKRLCFN